MKYNEILLNLTGIRLGLFEVSYVFGSFLETKTLGDLDILLVYQDAQELSDVTKEAQIIQDKLSVLFEGQIIDLTVLSKSELVSSGFLERVAHQRLMVKQ